MDLNYQFPTVYHLGLFTAHELNWTDLNKLSPRGRRDDMPPADGSSIRGGSTSVRGLMQLYDAFIGHARQRHRCIYFV